jgi:Fe-S-cluster containining protein
MPSPNSVSKRPSASRSPKNSRATPKSASPPAPPASALVPASALAPISAPAPVPLKPGRPVLKPGEFLCDYCSAKCCKYYAWPIDAPTTHEDYDFVRWAMLHTATTYFVEDEIWYLLVHAHCKHLQADNRCGIYHTRPQICRDYSTDKCEYEDDWTYEQYFELPEQVAEYIDARFNKPGRPGFRSPKPDAFPVL